jgi:phosphatidate cytidylyltransferase
LTPQESENKSSSSSSGNSSGNWSDLSQRLVSALVLATIVLFITWSGPIPFALLIGVGAAILCWEWAKMVRGTDFDELLVLHIIAVLVSCGLVATGEGTIALLVLLIGPAIKFGMATDRVAKKLAISLLGVPYIGLSVIALIWLRGDAEYGFLAILYLFVTVWTVDIFAYISGRTFGGPKFAPRISPKKTWSGFIGGVSAGAIAGMIFGNFIGDTSLVVIGIVSLVIGIISQLGDLFESAFKRHFNIKDASNLIPGHGGLFDRVDGLMFGAIVAALIALYFDAGYPGKALLVWNGGG